MQMKALSWDCATIPEKIQRTGWRDAGREGIGLTSGWDRDYRD